MWLQHKYSRVTTIVVGSEISQRGITEFTTTVRISVFY